MHGLCARKVPKNKIAGKGKKNILVTWVVTYLINPLAAMEKPYQRSDWSFDLKSFHNLKPPPVDPTVYDKGRVKAVKVVKRFGQGATWESIPITRSQVLLRKWHPSVFKCTQTSKWNQQGQEAWQLIHGNVHTISVFCMETVPIKQFKNRTGLFHFCIIHFRSLFAFSMLKCWHGRAELCTVLTISWLLWLDQVYAGLLLGCFRVFH